MHNAESLTRAGEHARGPTKILKRDPSSETASPHDYTPHSAPPSPASQPPAAPHSAQERFGAQSQAASTSGSLNMAPPAAGNRSSSAAAAQTSAGTQGQAAPAGLQGSEAPSAMSSKGPASASGAAQTPAGAAAAAAAQAALAGPLPTPKPAAPRYNPPGTLPNPSPAEPAAQRQDRPFQQQQQPGVSRADALVPAGTHHAPRPFASQQGMGPKQMQPRQQGPPGSGLSQADPRFSYQQDAGRMQMPFSEQQLQPQHGGLGPQPSPSQQITAQAARHEPQGVNETQHQAMGSNALPPNLLQFGSMQHVPNLPKNEGGQSTPNPLQFGIPSGMMLGARTDQRGQPMRGLGQPGSMHSPVNIILINAGSSFPNLLCSWSRSVMQLVMLVAEAWCYACMILQQHCSMCTKCRMHASASYGRPGGSSGQGQDILQGRQSSAEEPWQPEDAETQSQYMRQRAAQRQQAQVMPQPVAFRIPRSVCC